MKPEENVVISSRAQREAAEKQLILTLTDQQSLGKSSSQEKQEIDTILDLRGGKQFSLKDHTDFLAERIADYFPLFTPQYYEQIFRLNDWSIDKAKEYRKPPIVAIWTNEIIYGRFPDGLLPYIQRMNGFVAYNTRLFKHFQFLTDEGRVKVCQFISEATNMMTSCKRWQEFRINYCREYGVPFQGNLFENNG